MSHKGTRKDFVEWLRSKKPGEIVGIRSGSVSGTAYKGARCPLGQYNNERGIPFPLTGTARWVLEFMWAVDASGRSMSGATARKCLQLLGEDA